MQISPGFGQKRPRVAFQSQAAKRQTENTRHARTKGASSVQSRKSEKNFFSKADSATTQLKQNACFYQLCPISTKN